MASSEPLNYSEMFRLDGKAFVVLGVGEGIGRESCIALTQAGARVLCVDIDGAVADAAAAAIGGISHRADVLSRGDVEGIFAHAQEAFGRQLAGLVDVVGLAHNGPIAAFDDATISKQFDIVVRHAILAIQAGAPLLARNGGGSLTFIGSIAGLATFPGQTFYGAAKAALFHLVRSAAFEYGKDHIRVNAIAPGFTRTPRLLARLSEDDWRAIAVTNPMGRAAEPADIASAVLLLASDLARYITGNVLTLDGGVANTAGIPTSWAASGSAEETWVAKP